MKPKHFLIVMLLLSAAGCKKENTPSLFETLKGRWTLTSLTNTYMDSKTGKIISGDTTNFKGAYINYSDSTYIVDFNNGFKYNWKYKVTGNSYNSYYLNTLTTDPPYGISATFQILGKKLTLTETQTFGTQTQITKTFGER